MYVWRTHCNECPELVMAGLQWLIVAMAFVSGGCDMLQGLGILVQLQRNSPLWIMQHAQMKTQSLDQVTNHRVQLRTYRWLLYVHTYVAVEWATEKFMMKCIGTTLDT